jgi:hypothetical protein
MAKNRVDVIQRLLIALLVSLGFSYIVTCYNVSICCIYVTEYLFCILIVGSPDVTLMSTYTVLYGNDITMGCIITAVPNITRFKWQTTAICTTLHRISKIEQHEPH